jgi:hypothetical protein
MHSIILEFAPASFFFTRVLATCIDSDKTTTTTRQHLCPTEVESSFTLPLDWLLDPANCDVHRSNPRFRHPSDAALHVWGFSGYVLDRLLHATRHLLLDQADSSVGGAINRGVAPIADAGSSEQDESLARGSHSSSSSSPLISSASSSSQSQSAEVARSEMAHSRARAPR